MVVYNRRRRIRLLLLWGVEWSGWRISDALEPTARNDCNCSEKYPPPPLKRVAFFRSPPPFDRFSLPLSPPPPPSDQTRTEGCARASPLVARPFLATAYCCLLLLQLLSGTEHCHPPRWLIVNATDSHDDDWIVEGEGVEIGMQQQQQTNWFFICHRQFDSVQFFIQFFFF